MTIFCFLFKIKMYYHNYFNHPPNSIMTSLTMKINEGERKKLKSGSMSFFPVSIFNSNNLLCYSKTHVFILFVYILGITTNWKYVNGYGVGEWTRHLPRSVKISKTMIKVFLPPVRDSCADALVENETGDRKRTFKWTSQICYGDTHSL